MKDEKRWIAIILGLLVGHVMAVGIMVFFSLGDPSHVVEPDYYRKALAWDQKMDQDKKNAALAWRLRLQIAPATPADRVLLALSLADKQGQPIVGASVSVVAFHKARSAHRLRAHFLAREGRYLAALPIYRRGIWDFTFEITRGDQRFTHHMNRELFRTADPERIREGQNAGGGSP